MKGYKKRVDMQVSIVYGAASARIFVSGNFQAGKRAWMRIASSAACRYINVAPCFPFIMKFRLAIFLAAGMLAGCASRDADNTAKAPAEAAPHGNRNDMRPEAASAATTIDGYKRDLAARIYSVNAAKVFTGRPQALLRSVIVLRYTVDARGHLMRSEVMRSNHDRETETTALATLRNSAPFPQPAPHLLHHGRLELAETWLFNNDGRFQLRSIAEQQMDH